MITLKGVLPHDTLSYNFLINYNTLSHNFYQKRTPCSIIFTVKGHPFEPKIMELSLVERHIPSSQVWEYPPSPGWSKATKKTEKSYSTIPALPCILRPCRKSSAIFQCYLGDSSKIKIKYPSTSAG